MKSKWPTKKLGDKEYFEILGSGIEKFEGEKEYLSTSSIEGNKIIAPEGKITYQQKPSRANMQPQLNSVWFARMINTIKVYSFTEANKDEIDKYILSTGFAGVLCNPEKVNPRYLEKIFLSKWFNDLKDSLASDKAIQKSLNNDDIANLEIPLPPLPIQQKIVKILDTIQEAIDTQDKIIEKTKELKKSLMAELFKYGAPSFRKGRKLKKTEIGEIPEDWEVVRIKDVVLYTEQNDPSKIPLQEIKYIDVSSISNEFLKIIEYKTYLGKDAPSRARKILKENDVIFATVRPYLRRIAFITEEYNGFYGSTAFCVLRPNVKKIFPYFLFYYVSTDKFVYKVSGYQTGSGYPAITDDHIKNERISLPSLPEQQEIAEILQTIDQKIDIDRRKKELYEELFKTMLNKIMNQEIDVENIEV
jgi:type I restriction enzyme S subunit